MDVSRQRKFDQAVYEHGSIVTENIRTRSLSRVEAREDTESIIVKNSYV